MTARDLFPIAFYGDPRMSVDADVVNGDTAPVTIVPIQRKDFRAIQRPDNFLPTQRPATHDEASDGDPKASIATGDATSSPSPDPTSPPVVVDLNASAGKEVPTPSLLDTSLLMTSGNDAPPA